MYELLFLLIGYLVGSIPTGFLVARWKHGLDVRQAGSGRTGGYNTFVVTKSKWTAVGVGLFDAFKGFSVAYAAWMLFPEYPLVQLAGIVGALLGHNYPVWLGFKGGRGLATVAGALFAVNLFLLVVWCLSWGGTFAVNKDISKANILATVISFAVAWVVPATVIDWFMIRAIAPSLYVSFMSVVLMLLLMSHSDEIRAWLSPEGGKGDPSA
jgi:glycerol-3-phosphate acyltransferase PlsY